MFRTSFYLIVLISYVPSSVRVIGAGVDVHYGASSNAVVNNISDDPSKDVDDVSPKFYFFSKNMLSAANAAEHCESVQMQLTSILTEQEYDIIAELMKKQELTAHYWISGYRASKTQPWMWLTKDPIKKFYWNKGEPNNAKKNEFCIESFINKSGKYVWNDTPCSTKRRFICEKNNLCVTKVVHEQSNAVELTTSAPI